MQGWQQKGMVMDAQEYYICIRSNRKPLYIHVNQVPFNLSNLIDFLLISYKQVPVTADPWVYDFKLNLHKFPGYGK